MEKSPGDWSGGFYGGVEDLGFEETTIKDIYYAACSWSEKI